MSENPTLEIRLRADKSGDRNADGSWPLAGVEINDKVPVARLSTSLVRRGAREGWLALDNPRVVERPSQPDPDLDENGSATPSAAHVMADGSREDPLPHRFVHADAIILRTSNFGDVRYVVTHQPDKYADNSAYERGYLAEQGEYDDETPVTAEIYAAGNTRVDHFYDLALEA